MKRLFTDEGMYTHTGNPDDGYTVAYKIKKFAEEMVTYCNENKIDLRDLELAWYQQIGMPVARELLKRRR